MERACGSCTGVIRELEPAQCDFCETFFHVKQECCDVTRANMQQLFSCGKALWLCPRCRELFADRTLRGYFLGMQKERFNELEDLRAQVHSLTVAVQSLQQQIENNHAATITSFEKLQLQGSTNPAGTPAFPAPVWAVKTAKRRRGENGEVYAAKPARPKFESSKPVVTGTRILGENCSVAAPPPVKLFWVYLTNYLPTTTVEDVEKHVKEGLLCDEPVKVGVLVKKDADWSKLNYISFKVGVDPKYREAALVANTWPNGIVVREFEDRPKNGQSSQEPQKAQEFPQSPTLDQSEPLRREPARDAH